MVASALPDLRPMSEDGGVNELVEWLRPQINEDELKARAAALSGSERWTEDSAWLTDMLDPLPSQRRAHPGYVPMITREEISHIAHWDPVRVMAEADAKRRIVRTHEGRHECRAAWAPDAGRGEDEWTHGEREYEADEPCPTLRLLALPYADQPGYRDEWRPAE
jgi:hypothetical protein